MPQKHPGDLPDGPGVRVHVLVLAGHRHVPGVQERHPIHQVPELLPQNPPTSLRVMVSDDHFFRARQCVRSLHEDAGGRVARK